MNWKNLLACIFTPTTGSQAGVYGTGVPVQNGLILTARHVVNPENRDPTKPIRICWWYTKVAGHTGFREVQSNNKGPIVWQSKELDVALLRHPHPPGCEVVHGWLWLRPQKPEDGMKWASEGFPDHAQQNDGRKPSSFGGTVFSRGDPEKFFEIESNIAPETEEEWGGASGMPVVVNGKILGVVRQIPRRVRGEKLQAAPVWKLWQKSDFRALIQSDQFKRYKTTFTNKLEGVLGKSPELMDALANQLEGAAAKAAKNRDPRALAEALQESDPAEVFAGVYRASEALGQDHQGVQELATLLAPALAPFQEVSWVGNAREDPSVALVEIPAGTYTMAEVYVAAVEQRAVSLRHRINDADYPAGEQWLPLAPECGSDETGEMTAKAIRLDLEKRNLGSFSGELDKYFADPTSEPKLYWPQQGAPTLDLEDIKSIVQDRLRRLKILKKSCPYLAFHLRFDDDNMKEIDYIKRVVEKVRRDYPEILILILDKRFIKDDYALLNDFQMMLPMAESINVTR